jgi:hypothetical protein
MNATFHLPIHMTNCSGASLSRVALRTPGSVIGHGRMQLKGGRCTVTRSRNLPAEADATAEIFAAGFSIIWRLMRHHPLGRQISVRFPKQPLTVRFVDGNDRAAAVIPPTTPRQRPTILLDCSWAASAPSTPAAHFAGVVLLGTLSFLQPQWDRRRATHRVFDLCRLLDEGDLRKLMSFLHTSPADCGQALAHTLRQSTDERLALEQENLELGLLADTPTVTLLKVGREMDRLRFSIANGRLKPSISRLAWEGIGSAALAQARPAETPADYAARVLECVEKTVRWRDKWASWLLMQDAVDIPYRQDVVLELLDRNFDSVDDRRYAVNAEVSQNYDFATEGENIRRVARWSGENSVRLVAGRLSRAFNNQAGLLSAANYIGNKVDLLAPARHLVSATRHDPDLTGAATRVLLLAQEPRRTPYARFVGALNSFNEELVRFNATGAKEILRDADEATRHILARSSFEESQQRLAAHQGETDRCFDLAARLRQILERCPKAPAAYVVQLQRLHPGDPINLASANAFREVYSGKEDDLRDLVRQGGEHLYSAPGPGSADDGRGEIDTHWIIKVNDWVEAIPLFIKERVVVKEVLTEAGTAEVESIETQVDQEAMEAFFRSHAEYWARNLDEVMTSERIDLARQLIVRENRNLARRAATAVAKDPGVDAGEIARRLLVGRPGVDAVIARIAALIAHSEERLIEAIHRSVEVDRIARREALRRVLCETSITHRSNLVGKALRASAGGEDFVAACESLFAARRTKLGKRLERLQSTALEPTRPLSSLHVLTTESAGMTEGYVQSWLEEEMALFNAVRTHGLEPEVEEELRIYRDRIYEVGRRVIADLGMEIVVEEVMAEERVSYTLAVGTVVGSYRPVADQVAVMAVLLETEEDPQATLDLKPVRDLERVELYIADHRAELEAAAEPLVAANNGRAFDQRLQDLRRQHPDLELMELQRRTISSEADYRQELESMLRCQARVEALAEIDKERPELQLESRRQSYLRTHLQLAKSTARKRILARSGLNASTSDPQHYYQATGPNKRYNLIYAPSRVNLGHRERDSVVKWRQWVGGADTAAAQSGFDFYSLFNEGGVEERPALAHAEIQKTAENGLCVTHYAGSNALGLLCNAVLEGDAQDMTDQMNLREDRWVPPPGEGYGGYCVPKDGLFLAFVLSLTNQVKLRQLGVPEHLHHELLAVARRALLKQRDFDTELDWQQWAARELGHFENLDGHLNTNDNRLVFNLTKIARSLDQLGRPWCETAPGQRLAANLAAEWSVGKMIVQAEQVNRFMVFYKAWMIYDALRRAREKHGAAPCDHEARIALSAEYKPVQDVRFSTGLRLFEIFAKTGDHLRYALDEEGQNLVHLMFEGFDLDADDAVGRRAARAALAAFELGGERAEAIEQLHRAFPGHRPPADIVVTSVTRSSTNDILNYTSDARLDQIATRTQVQLADYGLSEDQIRANATVFGGDVQRWAGIAHRSADEIETILRRVGGGIHALALKLRGPGRSYERDLQGVDVLNTGIPFPELMQLLQNPPKLVALMLEGNPNSALVIADGCAGRAPRALAHYEIQAFFAACESVGRRGTYVGVGLGDRNIERLEAEMFQWRACADRLLKALTEVARGAAKQQRGAARRAAETYAEIQRGLVANDEAGKALRHEERLRRDGRWNPRDAFISQARFKVASGLELRDLDVGTWLAGLGGSFALMGKSEAEIETALLNVETAIARICKLTSAIGARQVNGFSKREQAEISKLLVCPEFRPDNARFTQQKLVESSSKAVEIAAVEALERRRALRVRAEKARAIADRERGFLAVLAEGAGADFGHAESAARATMSRLLPMLDSFDPHSTVAFDRRTEVNEQFGGLIGHTRLALSSLARGILGSTESDSRLLDRILDRVAAIYAGREIVLEEWKQLAGGYEDMGDLVRLAERAAESDPALEDVTAAMELFYVTFALAQTLQFALDDPDEIDTRILYKNLADFFAETIDDHWHSYLPWVYSRCSAIRGRNADELYALASRRHSWLYRYLRIVLVRCTDLRFRAAPEVDELLGSMDEHLLAGIGAGGSTDDERRWRAYNQLREISFILGDGFPAPVVFAEFDPELIAADARANLAFLYPVGRTHVSRALREGPTLCSQLEADGQHGANLLISRHAEVIDRPGFARPVLAITDAHLYIDRDTFLRALQQHKGLNRESAEREAQSAETGGALNEKGIRVAVRFVRDGVPVPVMLGAAVPFHGLPLFESGKMEDLGLPATVQSLIFSDITYDKSLYPEIFTPSTGVCMPPEMDWLQEYGNGISQASVRRRILTGISGNGYAGLESFAREHPIVLIKGAAESGARNLKVFDLHDAAGRVDHARLDEAADFLFDVSRHQNVVVQEAVLTSPEFWADPGLMRSFVERQIMEWNTPVTRERFPRSQIYGSLRIVASSPHPDRPYDLAFPIVLASLQVATNVGRGGTLEKLTDRFVREGFRHQIRPGLEREAFKVMSAMARFARRYEKQFVSKRGRPVGEDARGVSYAWPPYLMLDYLVTPVFARPGRLVDIEPQYDGDGKPSGSVAMLEDDCGRFEGEIVEWRFIHLEPNVGIGLWDRFNLREEVLEREASSRDGRAFDWSNVGTSDRVVLKNLVLSAAQYLDAIRS